MEKKLLIFTIVLILLATTVIFAEEILINQYVTDSQRGPLATMNTDDIFTVVWQSAPNLFEPWNGQDGSGSGVFGRQFNLDGSPLTEEFQVNTYYQDWQESPDVASFANGDFVVVWYSYGQDGDGYGVYGQRFSLDCTPIGEEFQVNTITSGDQVVPYVSTDALGNFIVAWSSFGDDSVDVYCRWYNSQGDPQGVEFRVNTYTQGDQKWHHVSMNEAGKFVVIWTSEEQDGDDYGVFGQRYNPDCTPDGDEFQINSNYIGGQLAGYVDMLPNGSFRVIWGEYEDNENQMDVYYRMYDALGNPLGDEFIIHEYIKHYQAPAGLTHDIEENLIVLWRSMEQDGEANGVFVRRFSPQGIPLGPEFQINEEWRWDQHPYGICCNGAGDFVVTWDSPQLDFGHYFWGDSFAKTFSAVSVEAKTFVFTAQGGDEDNRLEPGEWGTLAINLQNTGEDLENVTAILETDDPTITITDGNGSFGHLPITSVATNLDDPFALSLAHDAQPHLAHFILTVSGDTSTEQFDFHMYVGRPEILLVDDDQIYAPQDFCSGYDAYFTSALDSLAVQHEYWDMKYREGQLPTPLSDYDKIVWFTAHTDTNTLTGSDVAALKNFLDSNGKLFITGQNIGAEIGETDFYNDYLHASFVQNSYEAPIYAVVGVMDDPITNGLSFSIARGEGADNQLSPDVIQPTEGANGIFTYSMTENFCAGIRWLSDYGVVYLPFSFEAIAMEGQRQDLMQRVFNWLDDEVAIDDEQIAAPQNFTLHQNYPNPFNPSTTIAFTIPQDGGHLQGGLHLTLNIYDISGKLIKTLIDGDVEAGYHSVVWNGKDNGGKDVASGVYFYKLDAAEYTDIKQMLLVK